jgi:hypothetical protein
MQKHFASIFITEEYINQETSMKQTASTGVDFQHPFSHYTPEDISSKPLLWEPQILHHDVVSVAFIMPIASIKNQPPLK